MPKIRHLTVSGDPYRLGYDHGRAFAREIGELTEHRLALCATDDWAKAGIHRHVILDLAERCMPYHHRFDDTLCAELEGISDGSGVPMPELLVMNGFTDFVDVLHQHIVDDPGGCTAVMVAPNQSKDGRCYLAETWDMHVGATPYVMMLDVRPSGLPASMLFTLTGCVGMIGMNEAGLAVGINNLYTKDGKRGVTWPFVVRKMLAQYDLDAAMAVLESADLAGAHNYLVMGPDGRGYNVEATPTARAVTPLKDYFAHTNHCLEETLVQLERPRTPQARQSTVTRLDQAQAFLTVNHGRITPEKLMEMTRIQTEVGFSICQTPIPGYDVETAGACIMCPTTREMWAVWGQPTDNEYEHFTPKGCETPANS
ncbi:MAG: C45 family autoproteolytic acyltransferase/hydolase [Phycisphaeraceae bacterium]